MEKISLPWLTVSANAIHGLCSETLACQHAISDGMTLFKSFYKALSSLFSHFKRLAVAREFGAKDAALAEKTPQSC